MSSGPFFRDDTIFGICEALGEDFGLNPNWLRALIGGGLLFSPVMTFALYAACGFLVLLSRWLVPDPSGGSVPAVEPGDQASVDSSEAEELPLAA